jgi:transcriptional regulator with XRE-family HTH domain
MRSAAGWTKKKLAGKLGVSCQQVQKYEGGHDQIGVVTLHRPTRLFGRESADFFAGLAGGEAAGPLGAEGESAMRRWSQAVQEIGDREVRASLIDLARRIGRRHGRHSRYDCS